MRRPFGGYFQDLWRSASDLGFYGEEAALPFRAALAHLVKTTLLFGTIMATFMAFGLIRLNAIARWCRDTLPVIVIEKGEARTDAAQPLVIEKELGGGTWCAVAIDIAGDPVSIDPKYSYGVLVRKRGVLFKIDDRVGEYGFEGIDSLTVDAAFFDRLVVGGGWMALYAAGIYAMAFGLLLAQSAAAAVPARLLAAVRGRGYTLRGTMQMSVYAASLAACVMLLLGIAGVRLSPVTAVFFYLLIHLAFLAGGVLASPGPGGGHEE